MSYILPIYSLVVLFNGQIVGLGASCKSATEQCVTMLAIQGPQAVQLLLQAWVGYSFPVF